MLTEVHEKVSAFIRAEGLFSSAEKVTLAVSGGADSVALLYILHTLKTAGYLNVELAVAHVNHQLRGSDADADESFVIDSAKKLNLPVITRRVDVHGYAKQNKLSIETAARQLRLNALVEIAQEFGSSRVATAHQKNDNAETVLHRLRRGTGFRGLAGIWPQKIFQHEVVFVRPLLCLTRPEIIDYLKEQDLNWQTDLTNYSLSYTRNYIRHCLVPALQGDCTGLLVEQLCDLAGNCCRFYNLICRQVEKILPEIFLEQSEHKIALDLKLFSNQSRPIQVELTRQALTSLGSGERNLTCGHYEKVVELAVQKDSGRKIQLPNHFSVCRNSQRLIFNKVQAEASHGIEPAKSMKIPGRTEFGNYVIEAVILNGSNCDFERFKSEKSSLVEWFDFDKVKPPLNVRRRKKGDRFKPLGLGTEKKVGKFLTAAKISPETREKLLLVVTDSEKIIYLAPVRPSEKTKITDKTRKILQLKISPRG